MSLNKRRNGVGVARVDLNYIILILSITINLHTLQEAESVQYLRTTLNGNIILFKSN